MKAIFLIFLFLSLCFVAAYSQTTYHDPSLDTINGNIGNVDADLNGYLSQQLTLYQLNTNGAAIYSGYNSNTLPYVTTNALRGTNYLSLSNSAVAFAGMASNVFNYNGWNVNTDGLWAGPTATNDLIPLGTLAGTTFTMDLSYNFLASFAPAFVSVGALLRPLILAIFTFLVMIDIFNFLEAKFDAIKPDQAKGSTQSFLGVNASGPAALAYATIITASTIGLMTFFTAYLLTGPMATNTTTVAAVGTNIHSFTSGYSIWTVITTFLPISGLMTIAIQYVLFRYALAWPMFKIVSTIILFLVA